MTHSNNSDPPVDVNTKYPTGHPGGINAAFADGSVHGISYDIDLEVFNALGTRNGKSYGEQYRGVTSTDGAN